MSIKQKANSLPIRTIMQQNYKDYMADNMLRGFHTYQYCQQYCWQFVPFNLGCSRRGYCWHLIASNIPSTPSNIAGKIKGLKISFCLILMPNFECDEVILSFNFSLFLPKYVSNARTNIFSHKHKLTLIVQVVRINYRHNVILNV